MTVSVPSMPFVAMLTLLIRLDFMLPRYRMFRMMVPGAAARFRFPVMGGGALDDLVEFTPVQPDAAALRAVVDLYPLTVGHDQVDACTNGTFHDGCSLAYRSLW